ncbi:unnamed protein product [Sphagnum troendelagicum]
MADLVVDRKETRRVITGADGFGLPLQAALVEHLRQKGYEVVDLGVDKYYSVATEVGKRLADEKKQSPDGPLSRGLLVCGTGVGVSIFANKFGGVYAVNCRSTDDAINARSINNSNVITLGSQASSVEEGKKILDTWLETPFKAPCPASDGRPWNDEIGQFLDSSIGEMEKISEPALDNNGTHGCAICSLANNREFENVAIMPGGSWRVVREDPTSAVVKFKAGSLEPAHHHTFGHDLIVTSGTKTVWNLSTNEKFDLGPGDFLYTPAGDVHRVQYHEDTEFFIRWDGHWDILLDEDLDTAAAAVKAAHGS